MFTNKTFSTPLPPLPKVSWQAHQSKTERGVKTALALCVIVLMVVSFIYARPNYTQLDQNADYLARVAAYEAAVEASSAWTRNVSDVAYFLADYADSGKKPDFTSSSSDGNGSEEVTFLFDNLADDSITAKQVKFELEKQDGVLEIVSAGQRWRCRDSRRIGWTIRPCQ